LFEVAWEVCWQLGGIYTVLKTKAASMLEKWGDRYCLIGPYNPNTAPMEFEEQPTYGSVRDTLARMRESGLTCYFGRWLVPGRPRVILIDHRNRYPQLGEDKYLMWADHGISMPPGDGEVNDVVAFGFAVTEFFRRFTEVGRCGAYLRVLEEGTLQAGDTVEVVQTRPHDVTVGLVFRALMTDRSLLPQLLVEPRLPKWLRADAEKYLETEARAAAPQDARSA